MNKVEYSNLKKVIATYMQTLDINKVRIDCVKKGLLTQNMKHTKTIDDQNVNIGLSLLPSVLSGTNLCPNAGKCKFTCLAFAGAGNIITQDQILTKPIINMIHRTFFYLNDREGFEKLLCIEIENIHLKYSMMGKTMHFRLNTFSDIDWTHITNKYPEIQFYDYTKVWSRKSTQNYHLTFSSDEHKTSEMITEKLSQGENVAIVFSKKVPNNFLNFQVINGDGSDNRYNDPKGCIIGLILKKTMFAAQRQNEHGFAI